VETTEIHPTSSPIKQRAVPILDSITDNQSTMDPPLIKVDDKHVPLYRIVWVSDIPHFCGEEGCMHEGDYEIRLDVDDSLWISGDGRNLVVEALARWCSDPHLDNDESDWAEEEGP
jgi:hypothetical protein